MTSTRNGGHFGLWKQVLYQGLIFLLDVIRTSTPDEQDRPVKFGTENKSLIELIVVLINRRQIQFPLECSGLIPDEVLEQEPANGDFRDGGRESVFNLSSSRKDFKSSESRASKIGMCQGG